MSDNKNIKPPLGIQPEWLWKEERLYELNSAIIRYVLDDKPVPPEWTEETKSLREWIDKRKASHSIKEEEVGWEIRGFQSLDGRNFWRKEDRTFANGILDDGLDESFFIEHLKSYKILSIKRLSDSEVFTVGQSCDKWGVISGFKKQFSDMLAVFDDGTPNPNHVFIEDLQKAPKRQPLSIDDIPKNRCNVCGGEMVLIRGRYPKEDKRYTCPTCVTERLEQINEISSSHYGKTCKSNN